MGKNPENKRKRALEIKGKDGETEAESLARAVLLPNFQATVTLADYNGKFGELDLGSLVKSLTEQTEAANDGKTDTACEMLVAQAHTLDAIFNNLAQRAINAEYMNMLEKYLKLALRAQSQARMTWETLSVIKNPPIMGYVRQANIAHGHQQVNNGVQPEGAVARAGENPNRPNKVLEQKDGERLDARAKGSTGKDNTTVETLGAVHRAKDC